MSIGIYLALLRICLSKLLGVLIVILQVYSDILHGQ